MQRTPLPDGSMPVERMPTVESQNTALPGGMQSVVTNPGASAPPRAPSAGAGRLGTHPGSWVDAYAMPPPEGTARYRAPSVESARTVEHVEPYGSPDLTGRAPMQPYGSPDWTLVDRVPPTAGPAGPASASPLPNLGSVQGSPGLGSQYGSVQAPTQLGGSASVPSLNPQSPFIVPQPAPAVAPPQPFASSTYQSPFAAPQPAPPVPTAVPAGPDPSMLPPPPSAPPARAPPVEVEAPPQSQADVYQIGTPPTIGSWASEREALLATRKQVGEGWRLHYRDLLLALTGACMFVTAIVLLLTQQHRGYSVDRNPIRPGLPFGRPGTDDNCHNLWVWLATLLLLDVTHFLLHFLEEQVGHDPASGWFTTAIDTSDHLFLLLRVAASWYGIFLVFSVSGFLLVAILSACVGVILVSGVIYVGLNKGQEYGVGVGVVGTLTVITLVIVAIVDRSMAGTCKGLLHAWALTLASVYAISLAAALVYLFVVGRDEWTRRVKPRITAAVERFRQYTPQEL